MSDTPERIRRLLTERLEPLHLELRDDSARHAGHAGATSGGGHFHVSIVSARFESRSLIERHRMVYRALSELMPSKIHALGLKTVAPSEWKQG